MDGGERRGARTAPSSGAALGRPRPPPCTPQDPQPLSPAQGVTGLPGSGLRKRLQTRAPSGRDTVRAGPLARRRRPGSASWDAASARPEGKRETGVRPRLPGPTGRAPPAGDAPPPRRPLRWGPARREGPPHSLTERLQGRPPHPRRLAASPFPTRTPPPPAPKRRAWARGGAGPGSRMFPAGGGGRGAGSWGPDQDPAWAGGGPTREAPQTSAEGAAGLVPLASRAPPRRRRLAAPQTADLGGPGEVTLAAPRGRHRRPAPCGQPRPTAGHCEARSGTLGGLGFAHQRGPWGRGQAVGEGKAAAILSWPHFRLLFRRLRVPRSSRGRSRARPARPPLVGPRCARPPTRPRSGAHAQKRTPFPGDAGLPRAGFGPLPVSPALSPGPFGARGRE